MIRDLDDDDAAVLPLNEVDYVVRARVDQVKVHHAPGAVEKLVAYRARPVVGGKFHWVAAVLDNEE